MTETLIISVSGVRGIVGKDLTPEFVAKYAAAMGVLIAEKGGSNAVLGRDARTSGEMFMAAAQAGLQSVGIDVIDCGMIPTPTAQLAVEHHRAGGGIVLTASHNPVEWNALKLVGPDGMFLDAEDAERVRRIALEGSIERRGWDGIGGLKHDTSAILRHIEQVMALGEVDVASVKSRRFKVALDCARGVGGAVMPQLLESLGCEVAGLELETDG
ncbi:MAG: phosphoglucosamine mutase, partial [Gemmatimonadota bacterium]|nr:phosphoglucosamine mutase [Gemmatimonadota bacterium]